jgi:hypothetical protein
MPGCRLISTVERRIDNVLTLAAHPTVSLSLESPSTSLVCQQCCPVLSRQDRIHRAPRINRGLAPQSKKALRFPERASFLRDNTTPSAAPAMATCVPRPSKTQPKLTSCFRAGFGIRLPTLPPTERRLVATTVQGAYFFEPLPLLLSLGQEVERRLILPGKGRLGLLMSAGLGDLLGCAIQGDALIYSLSSGMADVAGYINREELPS